MTTETTRTRDLHPSPTISFIGPALACAFLAVLLMIYRRLGLRVGLDTGWVLAKEGVLENFTFIAELTGAALLVIAARWTFKRREALDTWLGCCYLLGGIALFVVGMEEISWGQQLFHFATPDQWAAINHQQETTLHNLLERDTLTESAHWMAYAFALVALLASTKFVRSLHSLLSALAPHASLVPMAIVIGIAGRISHPEIIELFIASYALVYSYQTFQHVRASKSRRERELEPRPNALTSTASATPVSKRLLVTGASGFIGSRVALYAREQHYDVVATGLSRTSAERARIEELKELGLRVHECDLHDEAAIGCLLEGCDAVIHLAAAQHEANVPESYFLDINVNVTRRLLDASARRGIKRFIYGSSIGVYGEAKDHGLSEESPLNPANAYARSKALAEQVVLEYANWLPCVVVRISETYGPGDYRLLKLFNAIARGLFMQVGRGANKRQPIHVRDLARGLLLAAEHPDAVGQVFVLAGSQVLTTSEVVQSIANALGSRSRFWRAPLWPFSAAATLIEGVSNTFGMQPPLHRRRLDFFVKSFWFDTSKARTVLGFEPSIPFSHGAAETAHWYRTRGLIKAARPTQRDFDTQPVDVPLNRDPQRPWQYSEILEFTHDAIIIWEMDGRGIVYWNRAAEQLYGYRRVESLGRVTHMLLQTTARMRVDDIETQLSRFGVWSGELQHVAKDGRRVLVQARLALMGQQNGRWLVLEVNRDLTSVPATSTTSVSEWSEGLTPANLSSTSQSIRL